jgi:hypothetical protein
MIQDLVIFAYVEISFFVPTCTVPPCPQQMCIKVTDVCKILKNAIGKPALPNGEYVPTLAFWREVWNVVGAGV